MPGIKTKTSYRLTAILVLTRLYVIIGLLPPFCIILSLDEFLAKPLKTQKKEHILIILVFLIFRDISAF